MKLICHMLIVVLSVVLTPVVMATPVACHCHPTQVVTADDIAAAQDIWGRAMVEVGHAYEHGKDYRTLAKQAVAQLYAYNYQSGVVLFDVKHHDTAPFHPVAGSVMQYLAGGHHNRGFALRPWRRVDFKNTQIFFHGAIAVASGYNTFTPYHGHSLRRSYVIGYVKDNRGNLKIFLQQ
jgi:hypothetical protein